MTDELLLVISGYGLPGVIISALFYGLYYVMKLNKGERDSWLSVLIQSNKISDDRHQTTSKIMDDRQKETNEVIRNLTAVIERNSK